MGSASTGFAAGAQRPTFIVASTAPHEIRHRPSLPLLAQILPCNHLPSLREFAPVIPCRRSAGDATRRGSVRWLHVGTSNPLSSDPSPSTNGSTCMVSEKGLPQICTRKPLSGSCSLEDFLITGDIESKQAVAATDAHPRGRLCSGTSFCAKPPLVIPTMHSERCFIESHVSGVSSACLPTLDWRVNCGDYVFFRWDNVTSLEQNTVRFMRCCKIAQAVGPFPGPYVEVPSISCRAEAIKRPGRHPATILKPWGKPANLAPSINPSALALGPGIVGLYKRVYKRMARTGRKRRSRRGYGLANQSLSESTQGRASTCESSRSE